MRLFMVLAFAAAATSLVAAEQMPSAITLRNGVFADAAGMTLYTADSDRNGDSSSCYDNCAHNWPPYFASGDDRDSGDWKLITREDGTLQWAYRGKPVYHFVLDRAAGETKGDGVGNVWHVARPR